jgi:hypothetical protein
MLRPRVNAPSTSTPSNSAQPAGPFPDHMRSTEPDTPMEHYSAGSSASLPLGLGVGIGIGTNQHKTVHTHAAAPLAEINPMDELERGTSGSSSASNLIIPQGSESRRGSASSSTGSTGPTGGGGGGGLAARRGASEKGLNLGALTSLIGGGKGKGKAKYRLGECCSTACGRDLVAKLAARTVFTSCAR